MDNVPERPLSQEKLQVPESWQFPERDEPGLKLMQIDPEERFLALTVPDGKGHKSAEYFFDTEGNISRYLVPRANSLNNIDVGLTSDIKVIYNIEHGIRSSPHLLRPSDISVFLISSKEDIMDPDFGEKGMLGIFYYKDGELHAVVAESIFAEGKSYIESPRFFLRVSNDGTPWRPSFGFNVHKPSEYDSSKREFDTGNFVLRWISRQKLDVIDKDKKQVFEIEFGEESDREDHGRRSLFISQKHTPTGIIKILRAPLRIDLQKIGEILNSKPPYNKERMGAKEHLVVPWRNIDRVVGASLSYSYPLQKPASRL